jgi:hypothetical protein
MHSKIKKIESMLLINLQKEIQKKTFVNSW